MTDRLSGHGFPRRAPFEWRHTRIRTAAVLLLAAIGSLCCVALELRFAGLDRTELIIGETPVTLYRGVGDEPAPPVIVTHGFAGSRQMMDQISVSLARQGFAVASVDLPGHGRHQGRLSPDITNIDGTTIQLVDAIEQVANAIVARPDTAGPVSLVGHSMASDVVIRAAQRIDEVGAVVAVSMYSPAVTANSPQNLLVISGAREGHLRQAGLEAVQQLNANAVEGETVIVGDIARRTAVAPIVGHVGVLYSARTLREVTTWIRDTTDAGRPARLDRTGWVAGVLFVTVIGLILYLMRWLPKAPRTFERDVPRRSFVACLLLPIPVILAIAALPTFGIGGHAAFGTLTLILATWGLIQIAILHRAGISVPRPDLFGTLVYLGAALIFAVVLDRYGAAFMPTGERQTILFWLLFGTLPLMLADSILAATAPLKRLLLARISLLATLAAAMAVSPLSLGLTFTILPVLVLFFLVYGTMARWLSARRGPAAVGLGLGLVLAWSIAASTPLFAITGAT